MVKSGTDMSTNKPFNVDDFIEKLCSSKNWTSSGQSNLHITDEEALAVCELAMAEFQKEEALATICPPCKVVGDIHGQYHDLIRHLNISCDPSGVRSRARLQGFQTNRYVFLGDFVDRGPLSLEVVSLVFALKVKYTSQYVLLRGNHETRNINNAYGFKDYCEVSLNKGYLVWEKFNEAFSWMPLACLIGGKILCMHGGISPELNSLDDIRNIKRPIVDVSTNKLAQDLLWADPMDGPGILTHDKGNDEPVFVFNKLRGLSVAFNEKAVEQCCAKLNIKLIIRAHQMVPDGFRWFSNRMITIFSAPRYMGETDNIGVVVSVTETGKLYMHQLKNKKPFVGKAVADELTREEPSKKNSSSSKSTSSK